MEHVREIDLIELAAGRLDPGRAEAVREHLSSCPACRQRFDAIQGTWTSLGAWEVSIDQAVPDDQGISNARDERSTGSRRPIRFPGSDPLLRVAAAVAVTVLIGYVSGRWSVAPPSTVQQGEPPAYIMTLGLELGDSFSSLVLQDELSTPEEG